MKTLVITLLSFHWLLGQNIIIPHQYTLTLKSNRSNQEFGKTDYRSSQIKSINYLNEFHTLAHIVFNEFMSTQEELDWLKNQEQIIQYQAVYKMFSRGCNPNDSAYLAQYNMEKMKFDEIWCYKTNGISATGDTLVVAAIDNGFSYWLNDILPNIFINRLEIPDNGLDDDFNGYKDDYYGLNAQFFSEGDNHSPDNHGTEVISVIGAKGNNQLGITGTNQNIKILLCSADNSNELVKCYHYFVKMKRDYLNSGGKKGAFIVSSNLSAGFDATFPNDLPLVCQAYDSLGKVGILNSVATVNRNDDIAITGDIPGLCPSDYMICVTNTDRYDNKVTESGYNQIHVDLGACGESIPMIGISGNVIEESGTSFASPHVAGLISLLYQFCPKINNLNKSNPDLAAKAMKDIILACGDDISSLKNITVTGKRINALVALQYLNNYCSDTTIKLDKLLLFNNLTTGELIVKFNPSQFGKYRIQLVDNLGRLLDAWNINFIPDNYNAFQTDISNYAPGVYHVYIEGKGQKWVKSLIKI